MNTTKLSATWEFTRPHTMIGTFIAVMVLWILATDLKPSLVNPTIHWLLVAEFAALLINVYIVGINQIYDVEIDRINKPYLPLASRQLSMKQGIMIVSGSAVVSLAMAWSSGFILGLTISLAFIIGTMYSVPPIRLKNYGVLSSLSIMIVRSFIVNLGIYAFFEKKLDHSIKFIPEVWFLVLFSFAFSLSIAITKDVPDLSGDLAFDIETIPAMIGSKKTLDFSKLFLSSSFLLGIIFGIFFLEQFSRLIFVGGNAILLLYLGNRIRNLDHSNKENVKTFYKMIWRLFYAEYLLMAVQILI